MACVFVLRHKEVKIYFKFTCLILLVLKICCQAMEIALDFERILWNIFSIVKVLAAHITVLLSAFFVSLQRTSLCAELVSPCCRGCLVAGSAEAEAG